jgi:hypothetical protein
MPNAFEMRIVRPYPPMPQLLINSVTLQVESDQNHVSGNATYQDLDRVPGWQPSRSLTFRLRLSMLQFATARLC